MENERMGKSDSDPLKSAKSDLRIKGDPSKAFWKNKDREEKHSGEHTYAPDAHESSQRTGSRANASLIPGSRVRVGDGTVHPSTLPYVKGTRQRHTLLQEEYYDWKAPRRTAPHANFVTRCQNPNCDKKRELLPDWTEPFTDGRCQACYQYRRKPEHGGNERPRELVLKLQERKRRPEVRAWQEKQDALTRETKQRVERGELVERRNDELRTFEKRCRNGHDVDRDTLDPEGRCPKCRGSFYGTGKEKDLPERRPVDKLKRRCLDIFAPKGVTPDDCVRAIDRLRADNIADELIDVALGQCETKSDVRHVGYLLKVARDFYKQRTGVVA
jgi:hypothetical protein